MKHIICIICVILGISSIDSCFAVTTAERDKVLSLHNMVRSEYNIPGLVWDTKIEKQAQDWANVLAKKGVFEHSTSTARKGMGENIYMTSTSNKQVISDGSEAVMFWYGEYIDYDYTTNSCNYGSVCGHFTQIIWKDTRRVGCGKSVRKKKNLITIYWVCQYDPAGNYEGERPY